MNTAPVVRSTLHTQWGSVVRTIAGTKCIKFILERATKAQRRSRGIALRFLNLGARWEWVVNATPRPLYPRERYPVPMI
jgi:hypothetical protein